MEDIKIYKNSNVVDVMVAQANKQRVDSEVAENAAKLIKD